MKSPEGRVNRDETILSILHLLITGITGRATEIGHGLRRSLTSQEFLDGVSLTDAELDDRASNAWDVRATDT